jgi:short-subunit dehydrogenase
MVQTVLITGASSGLGRGMAIEFAKRGCHLALCARRIDRLMSLKDELLGLNGDIRVSIRSLDVDAHDQVFKVFDEFLQEFGQLDRVIINAGIGKGGPIGTGQFEKNKQTAITNFVSVLAQSEAAAQCFRQQDFGHMVFISSVSALRGFRRFLTTYAATKAAVSSLAEGLAVEFLDSNIKVSAIHPGYIRTEINEQAQNVPFIIPADKGCRLIVNAIEKEKVKSFVPSWPWSFVAILLPRFSLRLLRKMS